MPRITPTITAIINSIVSILNTSLSKKIIIFNKMKTKALLSSLKTICKPPGLLQPKGQKSPPKNHFSEKSPSFQKKKTMSCSVKADPAADVYSHCFFHKRNKKIHKKNTLSKARFLHFDKSDTRG